MSDILSEREPLIFYPKHAVEAERKLHEARIEAQAAEIERLEKACAEWAEVSQSNYQRAKAAEAKLTKVTAAYRLEAMQRDDYSHAAFEQHLVELTGGKDE